jgi:hypothetical protein
MMSSQQSKDNFLAFACYFGLTVFFAPLKWSTIRKTQIGSTTKALFWNCLSSKLWHSNANNGLISMTSGIISGLKTYRFHWAQSLQIILCKKVHRPQKHYQFILFSSNNVVYHIQP